MGNIVKTRAMPTQHRNMRTLHHTLSDGTTVIENQNDVSSILKANHFQRTEQSFRHEGEVFNQVARIDYLAIQEWCKQRGIIRGWWHQFCTDDKLITEFLNDPDNKVWRTRLGKV